MRAFLLIGNLFKSNMIRVGALILIVVETIIGLIMIIDPYYTYVTEIAFGIISSILYGLAFLLFGYGVYKLIVLGTITKVTGIIYMFLGCVF